MQELQAQIHYKCERYREATAAYSQLVGKSDDSALLVVFWEICLSMDRQNPHRVFKTLQNQYTWASYDTLEKTIILSFAEKASVKRKACKSFRLDYTCYSASMGNPL